MRRRDFITFISGVAAWWPLRAGAQEPLLPIIGFLHVASANRFPHLVAAFRRGLEDSGYVEGQNLRIEFRWADGNYDRLQALATDLVSRNVRVIVTGGGPPSAFAAKAATATIPIVFNVGTDPVVLGLVASLSRPGGNATGVNIFTTELEAKRLGLLHELTPPGSAIAHLVNPNYPPTAANVKEVEAAARQIGRRILVLAARDEREIETAFSTISQTRPGAIIVGADPFLNSRRDQIVSLVEKHAIPAVYEQREFVLSGGLMSYGTSLADAYRQQGIYVGKILKGEKAADLPVVQLTRFELVINLKTAKKLGLSISPTMLARADEVIE
jgi:putative ABC transport system substrate-binding protein